MAAPKEHHGRPVDLPLQIPLEVDPEEAESRQEILKTLKEKMLEEGAVDLDNPATQDLPEGKNYFRMREVVSILGVDPHVIRFWETEFSTVRPNKSRGGQRVYRRKDVEALAKIRQLLHEEKLPIKEARQRLRAEHRSATPTAEKPPVRSSGASGSGTSAQTDPRRREVSHPGETRALLLDLRRQLKNLVDVCQKRPF